MRYTLDIAALPTGYGEALLPLDAAKQHIRVLHDDEDDLIEALRDAALTMVEQYTGLVLGPRTGADALMWRAECLPVSGPVSLGCRPVRSVVSVGYLDSAGDEQTADADGFRVVGQGSISPKAGASWPAGVSGGVVVTFAAGLEAGAVPAPLIHAAKMFLATLYDHRETVITGTIVEDVPQGFAMLCQPYRRILI